jgi:hypothetical protein
MGVHLFLFFSLPSLNNSLPQLSGHTRTLSDAAEDRYSVSSDEGIAPITQETRHESENR